MGIKLDLEQNSKTWHQYRRSRLGASDVPIILEKSPYKTRYQLWLEKTGKVEAPPMNDAMKRGHTLEPTARSMMEDLFEFKLPATVMQHKEMDYFAASLDGYNEEKNIIWECKACGRAEHNSLQTTGVPEKYRYQVQAQLLISGAAKCLFTTIVQSPSGESECNFIWVSPNEEDFKTIEKAVAEFYHLVRNDIAPNVGASDYEIRIDDSWKLAASDYRAAKEALKSAELAESLAKERLIKIMRGPKQKGYGVSCNRFVREGRVDYKAIPELATVDLNRYRKESREIVVVNVEENYT